MDTPKRASYPTGEILNEYFLAHKIITLLYAKTKNKTVYEVAGDSALTSQINYIVCFHVGAGTMSAASLKVHKLYNIVYDLNSNAVNVTSKSAYILGVCMILV